MIIGTGRQRNRPTTRLSTAARLAGALLLAAGCACVSACTAPAPASQPTILPSGAPTAAPGAATTEDPALAATKSTVESTLKNLVAGNPKPDRDALKAALVAAGIPAAALEVSVSRTPTGLDVDAMEAAALTGGHCVMGQIRDGGVAVTVLPVLATGKCFVGDVR